MTAPMNSTSALRQHAVSVAGIDGVWAKLTGGEAQITVAESWNGGATVPDITKGRKTVSNIVVDRPFTAARDRPAIRLLESLMATGWTTTVTDQDLDSNDQAIGDPVVFTGCSPIKVTGPTFDTEKADGGRFIVEFRVQTKL